MTFNNTINPMQYTYRWLYSAGLMAQDHWDRIIFYAFSSALRDITAQDPRVISSVYSFNEARPGRYPESKMRDICEQSRANFQRLRMRKDKRKWRQKWRN